MRHFLYRKLNSYTTRVIQRHGCVQVITFYSYINRPLHKLQKLRILACEGRHLNDAFSPASHYLTSTRPYSTTLWLIHIKISKNASLMLYVRNTTVIQYI